MPVALISTSTSPAFGPSRSSSTISSGFLASKATAARVFIFNSYFSAREPQASSSRLSLSLVAHARVLGLCIGLRLVLVLGRPCTSRRIVGAGAQIDIEVVHVAGHVRIVAESRHD